MSDSDKLLKLKNLLLDEDREAHKEVIAKIDEINEFLNTRSELALKIDPLIDSKISDFQESIPEKLGPSITLALKKQIGEAQDEIIDILYPIIGKLIKKYIQLEFQILSEKIDAQMKKAFSLKGWLKRIKGLFNGNKESELMYRDLVAPQLEEMFVIEKESGILKGSYSRNKTIDQDMIAGMLTAIKSFVEDAFSKKSEELEMIEYESYKILLYNFKSFYISVVVSGVLNAEFKAKMQDGVMDFSQKYMSNKKQDKENNQEGFVSNKLKIHFDKSNI